MEESTIFAESTSRVCSLQKYRKKCSVCAEYIQGSYYTKEDNFICAKCYKVRQWAVLAPLINPFALSLGWACYAFITRLGISL